MYYIVKCRIINKIFIENENKPSLTNETDSCMFQIPLI